ncbi:Replication factor A [uncultured archaeon]|nr:Replication factor A [uncultured archaeon]
MTDVDELVRSVAKASGCSEKEIREKMRERRERTHGLLSDYGAIYAVAKELGADLNDSGDGSHKSKGFKAPPLTKLSDVKPSPSVNVVGRVKAVFSPKEFGKKDGSRGVFASVVLMDKGGERRVVLWDNRAELVKSVRVGDVLLVRNGYSKDNNGAIEIHAGSSTTVSVNPKDEGVDLPDVHEKVIDVAALEAGNPSVTVVCRVASYYPPVEFARSDGTKGKRASFIGEDESGKVRVVLWDSAADLQLKVGDTVKIENGYTRAGFGGTGVELQAGSRSRVEHSNKKLKLPSIKEKKEKITVAEIESNASGFNIDGRVLQVYPPREYSGGRMASLVVGDATGSIRVVLWDDKVVVAEVLKAGDGVRIINAYSKSNLTNEPEVHIGKYGTLSQASDVDAPLAADIKAALAQEKDIGELENGDKNVRISGVIVEVEDRPCVYASDDGSPNLVVSLVVEDETGNVRAVAFRSSAEKILGIATGDAVALIEKSQDELAPIAEAKEALLEKPVSLLGRVKYNDFSDQLEFIVDSVFLAEGEKESDEEILT